MTPTDTHEINAAVDVLVNNKARWAELSIPDRITLLKKAMDTTLAGAEDQVRDACLAKEISFDSPTSAEEWLGGPMTTMRNLRLLVESLTYIEKTGAPKLKESAVRVRNNGQLAVQVFPASTFDKLSFQNFRGEVWIDPKTGKEEFLDTISKIYKTPPGPGGVALVLGAGNVASIGPMDVLHKLFVENQVCILKMNPVNDYLGKHVERAFKPFIDEGFLRVVYGGAREGDFLVHHEGIESIHITGSDIIHDIIVWGTPEEKQAANKSAGTPVINKPITSELGCVTPVIVVPGVWTEKQLAFQAENVATMIVNNASFNCNAAKILITSSSWPQRQDFLKRLAGVLKQIPLRKAYYPGSDHKYDDFLSHHPDATQYGERAEGKLPWTTIFGVDAKNRKDVVFCKEAWCGIIAETSLGGDNAIEFTQNAVDFCNNSVWGTLSCSIIASDKTQQEMGDAFEQFLADLRYGSVAVNHWPALSYGMVTTVWGAYPGHTLEDVRSGIGFVHNSLMIESPQKTVIWGPFTVSPKPPWFATHRNGHNVARKLVKFEHAPSFARFASIAASALKG